MQTQHQTFHKIKHATEVQTQRAATERTVREKKCSKSSRQFSHAKLHYFALTDSQPLKPKPNLMFLSSLSHMQGNGGTRMGKIFMHIHG
mgnify:CR=1 FL=1